MTTLTAHHDPRYGEGAAVAWPDVRAVLEQAELFWISTMRASGQPHVTPLIALWVDDALHFCTGPHEQKAQNLLANARCTFTTGCNTWNEGLDVVVEGSAVGVSDRTSLQAIADGLEQKYGAAWHFDVIDGGFASDGVAIAHVFRVPPARVYAFGKAPHSHTRYDFRT